MPPIDTDVLVVGSGFGGAAAALRLAEAGWRVTMLEKGPPVGRDTFKLTQDPQYLTAYLKGLAGKHINVTYAEALGGGSGFYEMVSLRAPTEAFALRDEVGAALWPATVNRATMDPWYQLAEDMLGVEQIGVDQIPRSGLVFAKLMKDLGYGCDRARYAVRDCLGTGYCVSGCPFGRKQSLHMNYLPAATRAGVTVACDSEVTMIRPIGLEGPAEGIQSVGPPPHRYLVAVRHGTEGETAEYRARFVMLGGGTVGTASLLLRSRPALPRLSRALGRHICFNGGARVAAVLPGHFPSGDMFSGRSHPGMISYEFLASHQLTISAVKPLPLQVVASARLTLGDGHDGTEWWGEDHVALMQQLRERVIILITLGMTPPEGRLALDRAGNPRIFLRPSAGLREHKARARALLADLLTRNGCQMVETTFIDLTGQPTHPDHFSTAHQVGSARMADSPARGVCNADGEIFNYPGLYVVDGAAIPSSLAVNTSLTILANAERIAAGMVQRHPRVA